MLEVRVKREVFLVLDEEGKVYEGLGEGSI